MQTLPAECSSTIVLFESLFSKPVWRRAQTLLIGAILAPAQRTVTAVLRVMGLSEEKQFQNYHRLLNRDRWSTRDAANRLLMALIERFVPSGVVLVGLDDTLERRRGKNIAAKGIYRDAVRSSHSHFVKASGLRWLCVMLIAEVPLSTRRWALPILTHLAPSERYDCQRHRRHKKLTDHARGLLMQLRRWLPERQIVCVCDTSFAALEFLDAVRHHVCIITRLRLDAALYAPAPERTEKTLGRPRPVGHDAKAKRLQNWSSCRRIPPKPGLRWSYHDGISRAIVRLKCLPAQRCGTTAASRWCRFVGYSCVTRRGSSRCKASSRPIQR